LKGDCNLSKHTSGEDLEKKLYSRNYKKYGMDMNLVVALTTGIFILIFVIYAIINLEHANKMFELVKNYIITRFDWVFILTSNFCIAICLYFAFSKLGSVKIGGVNSKPQFTNFAWYSMLISAGMGIGLMFWAVGEPLYHSSSNV
jgi:choline-glycine betaine transporter